MVEQCVQEIMDVEAFMEGNPFLILSLSTRRTRMLTPGSSWPCRQVATPVCT